MRTVTYAKSVLTIKFRWRLKNVYTLFAMSAFITGLRLMKLVLFAAKNAINTSLKHNKIKRPEMTC